MATLSKDFPPGVAFNIVYDPTDSSRKSVNAVVKSHA